MYKYGDYSTYINSLKYKTFNSKCNNQINCMPCNKPNNFELLFTDKTTDCKPVIITYDKQITYIEPSIGDNNADETRTYILQANNGIPNGTFKTIVNNIDVSKQNSSVTLITEHIECFAIFNKRYTKYTFAYLGEDLELLWNSSLSAWCVLKYSSVFD